MKSIIKNILRFILLFNITILSVLKVFIYTLFLKVSLQKSILQPIKRKKRQIVILGNGPSLKDTLKDSSNLFSDADVICVNEFSLSNEFVEIRPSFYLFLDTAYWSKVVGSDNLKIIQENYKNILEKVDWPITLLFPYEAKKWNHFIEIPRQNKNIKIKYFNTLEFNGFRKIRYFFYKKGITAPQSQNVLVKAIFLSINGGYTSIKVVGADHSWHENIFISQNNILYWKNSHFFDNGDIELSPIYNNLQQTKTFKMHEILNTLALAFKGYWLLEDYAKYRGCKVLNASKYTFIDAFERININDKSIDAQ